MPKIEGNWWQVAGNPDLGALSTERQQPVDFAVWQAKDGTWQLWSCIRHTKCGEKTRLFYRWEGQKLTDSDWTPKGIVMEADTSLGETDGGMQAPHVILIDDVYHMFYGDWKHICLATSEDGKNFTRRINANGKTGMFTEGYGYNTRDPMVIDVDGVWHCYYTAYPQRRGSVYCRRSKDLKTWSNSTVVAHGGQAGSNPFSAECPHVVFREPDQYYLFRTQRYGKNAQTSVYCSTNPLYFGIEDDRYFVCQLPVAAPEVIVHEGQFYIASLLPSLQGIHIAKLKWIPKE